MLLKLSLVLFLVTLTPLVEGQNLSQFIENDLIPKTCSVHSDYWKLIRWFFGRVTYIEITEISENRMQNSKFANTLIRELSSGKKSPKFV